ncbi:hypothetical protein IEQ34_020503 [Dendrobium chrysotoxum]|uniref:Uncharacterized protein n=1 Tax=Dendrobium chrysotoxum TaxID=161865 RepID=A0AAV7G137_DENCH|nr:hypothetical protein IEQ34_020503 [Dendrobium chrysotoxum]
MPIHLDWPISFLNLCPHFFAPHILHNLGSIFGRPHRIDAAIAVGFHPLVARVLVELDIM